MVKKSPRQSKNTQARSIWPDLTSPTVPRVSKPFKSKQLPLIFLPLALFLPGLAWIFANADNAWGNPAFAYISLFLLSIQLWPVTLALAVAVIVILVAVKRKKALILSGLFLLVSIVFSIALFVR